ncbi:LCP family protein [Pseudothermotoga thermarum]|uniref:Cell envelope-related transcriptional attenuator n=1 Tax=Pseudothermotoga thermarum DSM 5069 TaxID=688269 RepID=F7YYD2_9THEM|nr:LCP family protein [Pseudothermotoga thermarum]AEH50954.1 cell envelope-related transcriptional attenuator [Pseudothermotoga thermarum DSM 5069]
MRNTKALFMFIACISFLMLLILAILAVVSIKNLLFVLLPSKIEQNPIVVLLVGTDQVIQGTVRTDAIVIAIVDHVNAKAVLTNVPRDLILGGSKINSVYQKEGIQGLIKVLQQLLKIEINRYVVVDYEVFKYLGDKLGPIEIVVKESMHYEDSVQNLSIHFEPGVHKMKGDQLLAYIRYRKDSMGDLARIERQREVLTKLANKALSLNFQTLQEVVAYVLTKVKTDFKPSEILYLGLAFKRKGLSLSFVNFPYAITERGEVVFDEKKLQNFKDQITFAEYQKSDERVNVLILNCTPDKSRNFLSRTLNLWNASVGFSPEFVIWEDIGINYQEDVVLILNASKASKIVDVLKKVYPEKNFRSIKSADALKEYFAIMDKASQNRIYLKGNTDAVVVVTK